LAKIRNPHPKNRGPHISQPLDSGTGASDHLPPVFSLRHLQTPYCVTSCSQDHQAAFVVKLRKLSEMTWRDIKQAPRKGLGSEKIPRHQLRVPVPATVTEDVEFFLAIRYNGNHPMVGYRSQQVFHVVWLDHNFTVYPHE